MFKLQQLAVFALLLTATQSNASIGSKIDELIESSERICKRAVVEVRYATGLIPPLTIENIKKYPQYKDAYITYAAAHMQSIDPLILAALVRQYPGDIAKISSDKFKQKVSDLLK